MKKDNKNKAQLAPQFRRISEKEFQTVTYRPISPEVSGLLAAVATLEPKQGIAVSEWIHKSRPIVFVRGAYPKAKWSERKLPDAGCFAILRTK